MRAASLPALPFLPVLVWAAHFTILYGFTALACARQIAAAIPWVAGAASVAALAALALVAVPAGMRAARTSQFPEFMTVALGGLAAVAIVWEASSLFWVPACA